jgi:hypothetical protein
MTLDLAYEISELALCITDVHYGHDDRAIEHHLLEIIQKGVQAYEDHTGKELDPLLIRPGDEP